MNEKPELKEKKQSGKGTRGEMGEGCKTNGQTDRMIDRQTDGQTDRTNEKQSDRVTDTWRVRQCACVWYLWMSY